VVVTVAGTDKYLIGEATVNGVELSHAFSSATNIWHVQVPVAIRAKPATPFSNVWRVVTLASANGCTSRFDVRLVNCDWPKYLDFYDARIVVATTTVVRIVCDDRGFRYGDEPVTVEQLDAKLRRLADTDPRQVISIVSAGNVPLQTIVGILDSCEHYRLNSRLLQIDEEKEAAQPRPAPDR
jgi:biopolymer transport protein ExbD